MEEAVLQNIEHVTMELSREVIRMPLVVPLAPRVLGRTERPSVMEVLKRIMLLQQLTADLLALLKLDLATMEHSREVIRTVRVRHTVVRVALDPTERPSHMGALAHTTPLQQPGVGLLVLRKFEAARTDVYQEITNTQDVPLWAVQGAPDPTERPLGMGALELTTHLLQSGVRPLVIPRPDLVMMEDYPELSNMQAVQPLLALVA